MNTVTAGEILETSGFATVHACRERTDVVVRKQPMSADVIHEVHIHRILSTYHLAPDLLASYIQEEEHIMVLTRFQMDLGHWLRTSSPCRVSMWCMRLRRLLRGMASRQIFAMDLKPENVVVNLEEGSTVIRDMRLIDFGGGLCWECAQVPETVLYASMLLVFSASLCDRYHDLFVNNPFEPHLRRALQSTRVVTDVYQLLCTPEIARLWTNLFHNVVCVDYIFHHTTPC